MTTITIPRRQIPTARNGGIAALVVALVCALGAAVSPPARGDLLAAAPAAAPAALPEGGLVPSARSFGWTQGSFAVTDDGAATYSLPLWAPTGRGTVTPQLALTYSSRAGNGPLGLGWELAGLPSITRCPETRAIDGRAEGLQFVGSSPLCLGGERLMPILPSSLTQREFRTERDSFARIVASLDPRTRIPHSFEVETKDGQILSFGATADSELTAKPQGSDDRVTLAWAVNEVADRNGNEATITYHREEVDEPGSSTEPARRWVSMRPAEVRYAPNRLVLFRYESRPDPVDGFAAGVRTRISHRLSSVAMLGGPQGGTASLLREYRMSYLASRATGRSLLSTVTECDGQGICKLPLPLGYTSAGNNQFERLDLPGITDVATVAEFGGRRQVIPLDVDGDGRDDLLYVDPQDRWKLRRSTGSGFGSASTAGIASFPAGALRAEVKLVDFDLDGRTDVLAQVPDSPVLPPGCEPEEDQCVPNPDKRDWRLYRSTGTGFVAHGTSLDSGAADADAFPDPVFFGDLDGNGTPDFLTAARDDDPGLDGSWRYRLNDGTEAGGWFGPERDTRSSQGPDFGPNRPSPVAIIDTDGDGRTELLGQFVSGGTVVGYRSVGLDAFGEVEIADFGPFSWDLHGHLGDVNGDGLVEEIRRSSGTLFGYLNSGRGLSQRRRTPFAQPAAEGERVADFTGDGNADLVTFHATSANNPVGIRTYSWTDDRFERQDFLESVGIPDPVNGLQSTQLLDADADGLTDVLHVQGDHLRLLRRQGVQADLLVDVGLHGLAPRVQVDYTTLGDRTVHAPCVTQYPLACPASGGAIVSEHRSATYAAAGQPEWDVTRHRYADARVDLLGRGWLGFSRHTLTRGITGAVATVEMDNTTRDDELGIYPFAGAAERATFVVPTGLAGKARRRTTTYDLRLRPLAVPGTYTVESVGATETEQERPSGVNVWQTLRTVNTATSYDTFGNPERSTYAAAGGRITVEDRDFRNDTGEWLIGLPTRHATRSCTSLFGGTCTTRTSTFAYDANGNLTESVVEPDDPQLRQTTTTTYGEFGVVTAVSRSDSRGQVRTQRFQHDADLLNPTAVTNALGHTARFETHSGLGVTLRVVDPNGVESTMRYDGFGRPRETYHADGSFQRIDHVSFLGQLVTVTDAAGAETEMLLDQLGRTVRQKVKSFDGRPATQLTEYDALGRVSRVSRPHLPGETVRYTTFGYDAFDRPLRTTAPNGATVRHEYVGRQARTTDPKGRQSILEFSVDGDITSSLQPDPASDSMLQTRFEYGPFGETTKVIAPDGTAQVLDYDRLGRVVRHQDPSAGLSASTYNAFGELVAHTDANDETTTYVHDRLGRVTRSVSPDGTTTLRYDTAEHGIGLPALATSTDAVTTTYTYDELARPATTTTTVPGSGTYETEVGYDGIGRLSRLAYPPVRGISARFAVTYAYNAHGYLAQVEDAAVGTPYWTANQRNALGQLESESYGNQVTTTRAYEPDTGLLARVAATSPGGTQGDLEDLRYTYDLNGNVATRRDVRKAQTLSYGYDELDRLAGWTSDASPDLKAAYAYDKVGNLRSELVQQGFRPDRKVTYTYGERGAPPHALTSRNADSYTYDNAGQQVTGPGRSVAYNTFGLPTALDLIAEDDERVRTTYRYDAAGARVAKSDAEETVVTIGGLFEQRTATNGAVTNLHHVVADGRVVAAIARLQARPGGPSTGATTTYLTQDHQGSTVEVTDTAGGPVEDLVYDPWGVRVDAQQQPLPPGRRDGTRVGYTGHEHDDEHGLVDAGGRIYDPTARRFLTPDPIVADVTNSQHHNRYAYVANNPTTFTDPSGLLITGGSPEGPFWEQRGGGSHRGGFAGFTALGYPSGGQIGWMGPFFLPFTGHGPDMARSVLSAIASQTVINGLACARLAQVVSEWYRLKGVAEAATTPPGYVYVTGDIQEETAIRGTVFFREGNSYMVWYEGASAPVRVTRREWEDVKWMAALAEQVSPGDAVIFEPDSGTAMAAASGGVLIRMGNWRRQGSLLGRAFHKAVEIGLSIDHEGKLNTTMKPAGEYVMQTEKQALQEATQPETRPARTGIKQSGGSRLRARGGGVLIWSTIIGIVTEGIYESDWALERRARKNGVSVDEQRWREWCANDECS